jgi:hypothetical protein
VDRNNSCCLPYSDYSTVLTPPLPCCLLFLVPVQTIHKLRLGVGWIQWIRIIIISTRAAKLSPVLLSIYSHHPNTKHHCQARYPTVLWLLIQVHLKQQTCRNNLPDFICHVSKHQVVMIYLSQITNSAKQCLAVIAVLSIVKVTGLSLQPPLKYLRKLKDEASKRRSILLTTLHIWTIFWLKLNWCS